MERERLRDTEIEIEDADRTIKVTVVPNALDENGEPIYATADAIAAGEGGVVAVPDELIPTYIKSPGSATYDSLRDFATEEPEQVARVLRTWIST